MTDLLSRPLLRVETTSPEPRRPVALSAAVAALACTAGGLVVTIALAVVAWFAADTGSFGESVRVGALAWLVGNGAGLHLASVEITMVPLGAAALAAYLLYRGGLWVARRCAVGSARDLLMATVVMGAVYAAGGTAVDVLTRSGGVSASLPRTLLTTSVLGLLAGGLGVLRGAGRAELVLGLLPDEASAALTGGTAGSFAMVVFGGLTLVGSLARHFSSATSLSEGMQAGAVGSALLALIGLALVPNAILCAGAYLAGPGFVVGTGTTVAPDHVTLGRLPALPLLGALPRTGGAWWQSALVVVPLVAGVVAGLVAVHRYPVSGHLRAAVRGGLAGLVAGLAFGSSTWLATGAVGPGRMRDFGPDVPATLLVCGAAMLIGGAAAAAAASWLGQVRASRRPDEAAESLS